MTDSDTIRKARGYRVLTDNAIEGEPDDVPIVDDGAQSLDDDDTIAENLDYLAKIAEYNQRVSQGLDLGATATLKVYKFMTKKRRVGWPNPFKKS